MDLTIGLDIAKNFFQVHAIDAAGVVVTKKMLRRSQMHSLLCDDRAQLGRHRGVLFSPLLGS